MNLDMQNIAAMLSQQKAQPAGIASGGRTMPMDAIKRRLSGALEGPQEPGPSMEQELSPGVGGMNDPRGLEGILARGSNVYGGGVPQAQAGGGSQYGAPVGGADPMMGGAEAMLPPRNAILRKVLQQRMGGNGFFA